jgi:hypothetical protein
MHIVNKKLEYKPNNKFMNKIRKNGIFLLRGGPEYCSKRISYYNKKGTLLSICIFHNAFKLSLSWIKTKSKF